jgi:hypothetical protein
MQVRLVTPKRSLYSLNHVLLPSDKTALVWYPSNHQAEKMGGNGKAEGSYILVHDVKITSSAYVTTEREHFQLFRESL